MRIAGGRLGLFLAVAGVAALALPTGVPAAGLSPHRAFYALSLDRAAPGTGIAAVSGVMSFSLKEACDAWVLVQRILFVIRTDRGTERGSDIAYTAWESKDGRDLAFHTRIRADGQAIEEVKGTARIDRPGGEGTARFARPAEGRVRLPKGTSFPVTHLAKVLSRAAAGEALYSVPLFDGSLPDGALLASALIGARFPPSDKAAAGALRGGPSWRVSAALYPFSGDVEIPVYRTAFRLWESGVAGELVIDYGDFSLAGELQRVEPLARPNCPAASPPSSR